MMKLKTLLMVLMFYFVINCTTQDSESWKKKNVNDMTDADLERLLDQWEENDDPLEPDELPEHLRPAPKIDLSEIDLSNPDNVLRETKRGKSVMMFVDVIDDLSESEAENILRIWQGSLQNSHIVTERYPIEAKRAVFMFREGSQAVEGKDFFVDQPELERVTLEGRTYYGKNSSEKKKKPAEDSKRKTRTEEL